MTYQETEPMRLWKVKDLFVPPSVKQVVIHCRTNSLDHDEPKAIDYAFTKIGKTFQPESSDFNIILTGLLPRDLHKSKRRNT